MAAVNYRTIDIDALDPESAANFDLAALAPGVTPVSTAEVQSVAGQIRQLLRGGDSEGALRGALENVPYGADKQGKDLYAALVVEILQSIRQAEMSPLLNRIFEAPGGPEQLDVLMKYLYKGMAPHAGPSANGSSGAANPTHSPSASAASGFSQVGAGRSFGGGAAAEGGGQAMSVLLSWHEKVVDVAGLGCVVRVMSDRRTV